MQIVFTNYDQDTRKMRAQLKFDSVPTTHPMALIPNGGDEPTRKTDTEVFTLISILRVLDVAMFYEGYGCSGNAKKVPKDLTEANYRGVKVSFITELPLPSIHSLI